LTRRPPSPIPVIDLHSHLIPGIDDGADTLAESLEAVAEMRRDGIRRIVTTPHLDVSLLSRANLYSTFMDRMDAGWESLAAAVAERFPEIRIDRGVELALDALPPELTDSRLFLAGTRFILMEFPHFRIPPNSERAIQALRDRGIHPVLGHPERYTNMDADLAILRAWKERGAIIQINSGSLVGLYGDQPRRLAEAMIRQGLADCLSSDYHARGKCTMRRAAALLENRGMGGQVRSLTEGNAASMLGGHVPRAPHTPSRNSAGFWKDLVRRLRRS
jgi:protein-tyrosine phosphatase